MIDIIRKGIENLIRPRRQYVTDDASGYEYCPRCYANLTLQKGYGNELPYWICKGCGEMLINPEVEEESGIAWICDGCGAMLNVQQGFSERYEKWACTECGFENRIDPEEVYLSEAEFQKAQMNPYKGLSDEEVLKLSAYTDEGDIKGRSDIRCVRNRENGERYVEKLLTTYNRSVYDYLKDHPISHMPRISELYESDNCLIVIEEYIEGRTVSDMLEEGPIAEGEAVRIAKSVCVILDELHRLPTPIIHRDIKPANIMITPDNEVYLLDMNVARWYDPDKTEDTRYLGTMFYASPEQCGYGLSASSAKSDIYAAGVLLNVMITGKTPKEERAQGPLWDIIERCIRLDADDRYTDAELITELDAFAR